MIFYKCLYGLSASIMKEVFTKRILEYHLRSCRVTLLPNLEVKKYSQLIRLPNYKTTLEYATSECFLLIKSQFYLRRNLVQIAFWLISEIFQKSDLEKVSSQLSLRMLHYYYYFCCCQYKYQHCYDYCFVRFVKYILVQLFSISIFMYQVYIINLK